MAELQLSRINFLRGDFRLQLPELQISAGEKVAILGENGSGKSTLLQLLTGLLTGGGRIEINGRTLDQIPVRERAGLFALLPQRAEVIFPFSVFEVVQFGRFACGDGQSTSEDDRQKTALLLGKLDLQHLAERNFTQLSGGEQRRVMLARALNQETEILFLDEPNASLDVRHSLDIFAFLQESEQTVVAPIHDINLAVNSFTRFWLLKNGQLLADVTRAQLTPELLSETFDVQVSAAAGSFIFSH